jgi:SAM-dependent methyltransferase
MRALWCAPCFALLLAAQAPDKTFWNKTFENENTRFNRQPSRLVVDAVQGRTPGAAIDLGMGEGRNAIFLAQQGWRVTGVDLSDVAVDQAKKRAAELGLSLATHIEDLDKFDFGREEWDLIALCYMHGWYHLSKLDSPKRLREALRPGGMIVIEGFAGGETGYQTNELLRAFSDLKIMKYEDLQGEADWAPGRKSRIIRLVAEKVRRW